VEPNDGPRDPGAVADAIEIYFAARGVTPRRITTSAKTVAFRPGRLRGLAMDHKIHAFTVWVDGSPDTTDIRTYLRPFDVNEQRFQTRQIHIVWTSEQTALDEPLLAFLRTLADVYPIEQGSIGSYASRGGASRECLTVLDNSSELPAETAARLNEDGMSRYQFGCKLRRLYPVTIIGPEIWAALPPMPAFDPMPTVEDLGNCKLVTAWPTLCEPRDPAFLRGTRDLRAWLWPYTIQNPADHVDNDPKD
jgi:hypothetical protein